MQLVLFVGASFLGVVVGAVLQYVLGLRAEQQRNIQLRRTEAYVDLIKSLAAIGKAGDDEQGRQLQIGYAEARTRVAIYGSTKVVGAFASFLRLSDRQSAEAPARLVEIVTAMRIVELGKGPELPAGDIAQVLFVAPGVPTGER